MLDCGCPCVSADSSDSQASFRGHAKHVRSNGKLTVSYLVCGFVDVRGGMLLGKYIVNGLTSPLKCQAFLGLAQCADEEEHILQSIRMILLSPLGSRPMEPTFGCRLHELLFQPASPTLRSLAAFYVEMAISEWETRVQVRDVSVELSEPIVGGRTLSETQVPGAVGEVVIRVTYSVKVQDETRTTEIVLDNARGVIF